MNAALDAHLAEAMYALNKALDHTGRASEREIVLAARDAVADLRNANDPKLKL